MASWNPFGVSLNITAVAAVVTRKSATQFTVKINASWACASSGNKTDYGMTAASGGGSVSLNEQGTKASSGSGSFTGTYSISGNGGATKKITVTFTNFNTWHSDSATKDIVLSVGVPAWTSYTITYNANGGSGAPAKQTKWHGEDLKISSAIPTRTGYTFSNWALTQEDANKGDWYYKPGSTCGANKNLTLFAVWIANNYAVKYEKNAGTDTVSNMPDNQTKHYGIPLPLSSKKPTRANYTFKGWGGSPTATTVSYEAGKPYMNNAEITLYAIWESSYTKPRINNLRIDRCDSYGDWQDDGSDIRIDFDYELDKNETPTMLFSWKLSTDTLWIDTVSLTDNNGDFYINTGTYGSVYTGTIDPEKTYSWELVVTDSGGSTTITGTVQSLKLAIDVKPPKTNGSGDNAEYGVAINKTAQRRGWFDVSLKSSFDKEVHFKNGIKFPVLASDTDFDDVRTPGQHPFGAATTFKYKNCPINSATSGVLEVIQAGDGTQLLQRITTCSRSTIQNWERCYHEVTEAAWGSWVRSGARLPAMSAYLSGNQTTVASSYTNINFAATSETFGLTLIDGGIKIGAGISQVLVSLTVAFSGLKANGMKHIKIKRNSANCEWVSGYGVSGNDLTLTISPRLMNVSENDIITATYYSYNADETISAGSSGNGWKTCLTVVAVL